MAEHPLKIFEKIDPELLGLVQSTNALAIADGALPRKFKLLCRDSAAVTSSGLFRLTRRKMATSPNSGLQYPKTPRLHL